MQSAATSTGARGLILLPTEYIAQVSLNQDEQILLRARYVSFQCRGGEIPTIAVFQVCSRFVESAFGWDTVSLLIWLIRTLLLVFLLSGMVQQSWRLKSVADRSPVFPS
jgi:hypothetical protein